MLDKPLSLKKADRTTSAMGTELEEALMSSPRLFVTSSPHANRTSSRRPSRDAALPSCFDQCYLRHHSIPHVDVSETPVVMMHDAH
jgi:hypothetical protein